MRKGKPTRFVLPAKCEALEQAKTRRDAWIAHLRRIPNNKAVRRLARRLSKCKRDRRCELGACPVCMRLYRIRWVKQACRVLAASGEVYRVSIILDQFQLPRGSLGTLDLAKFMATLRRLLQRTLPAHVIVVGGLDLSLNTFANGNPYWCPHLYLLMASVTGQELSGDDLEALRKLTRGSSAPRPYMASPVALTGLGKAPRPGLIPEILRPETVLPRVVSYALKAEFVLRSGYLGTRGPDGAPCHNTRPQSLRGGDLTEAILFLGKHTPGDRLLLKGVKRYGSPARFTLKRV